MAMDDETQEPGGQGIGFATAAEANRRVAGVAAAARAARQAIDQGARSVHLVLEDGGALDAAALCDLDRVSGEWPVSVIGPGEFIGALASARIPTAAEVLSATRKPSDGPISRWLNRPISRALSAQFLKIPGVSPMHATLGTAVIALAMFAALIFGEEPGLIAGGLLFHAASVFDGVDGEIARATYRTSAAGASLDSAVDVFTNLGFVLGLTLNLGWSHGPVAFVLGGWSLVMLVLGFVLVARRSRNEGQLRFEWLKRHVKDRAAGTAGVWLARAGTFLTTRDSIAFFFMFMVFAGLAMPALCTLTLASTIWMTVLVAALLRERAREAREPEPVKA